VNWVVRDETESAKRCDEVGISKIRIQVLQETDGGMTDLCAEGKIGLCTFDCKDGYGATPFRIPTGWYYFGLSALSSDGTPLPPGVVSVPAPVFRRVIDGQMLDLGVWQVVVTTRNQTKSNHGERP